MDVIISTFHHTRKRNLNFLTIHPKKDQPSPHVAAGG